MKKFSLLMLLMALLLSISFSNVLGNGNWKVLDSSHFRCIFYEKDYSLALKTLSIAEDALIKISDSIGYDYKKELKFKIPIVLVDYMDLSNGSSNMLNKAITIYLFKKDILFFGGNLRWLRRVISHELTHTISFLLMRVDISDFLFPSPILSVPDWFLEGTARYFGEEWDYNKEDLIASSLLNSTLLSYDQLSKNLNNLPIFTSNLIYEQGHSIVRYIAATYGATSIGNVYREIGKGKNFNDAFKNIFKKTPLEIYNDWKDYESNRISSILSHYSSAKGQYDTDFITLFEDKSSLKFSPLFFSNGRYKIATYSYDSNIGILDLILIDRNKKSRKVIDTFVGKYFDFHNATLYYTKLSFYKNGFYSDLYLYDLKSGLRKRLTFGQRVRFPAVANNRIFLSKFENGKNKLVFFDLNDSKIKNITNFNYNFDFQYLKYNSNLHLLLFRATDSKKSYIGVYNTYTNKIKLLTTDFSYKTNPKWCGNSIIYISTLCGLPQLFEITLNSKMFELTNFNTGVLDASCYDNKYYLSIMDKDTFKIVKVSSNNIIKRYPKEEMRFFPTLYISDNSKDNIHLAKFRNYSFFDNLTYFYLFPSISISSNGVSASIWFYLADTLQKENITLSLSNLESQKNIAWQLSYENKYLYPDVKFSIIRNLIYNNWYSQMFTQLKIPFYSQLNKNKNLYLAFSAIKIDSIPEFETYQSVAYGESSFSNYNTNYFDPKNGYSIYLSEKMYFDNFNFLAMNLTGISSFYFPINLIPNSSVDFQFFFTHNFGNDYFNYVNVSDPFIGITIPLSANFYNNSTYLNLQISLDILYFKSNASLRVFSKVENDFNLTNDWYKNFDFSIGSSFLMGVQSESLKLSLVYNITKNVINFTYSGIGLK